MRVVLVLVFAHAVCGSFLHCMKDATARQLTGMLDATGIKGSAGGAEKPCLYAIHTPTRPERRALMDGVLVQLRDHVHSSDYLLSVPWQQMLVANSTVADCFTAQYVREKRNAITVSMNSGHIAAWISYLLREDCSRRPLVVLEDDAVLNTDVAMARDVFSNIAAASAASLRGVFVNLGQCLNAWMGSDVPAVVRGAFRDADQRWPALRQLTSSRQLNPTYCLTAYSLDKDAVSAMLGAYGTHDPIFLADDGLVLPVDHLVNRLAENTRVDCYYSTRTLFRPDHNVGQKDSL